MFAAELEYEEALTDLRKKRRISIAAFFIFWFAGLIPGAFGIWLGTKFSREIFIIGGCLVSLIVVNLGLPFQLEWRSLNARISNLKKSSNNLIAINKLIEEKLPYILFLREFHPESETYLPANLDHRPHGAMPKLALRGLQQVLIEPIDRTVPVFSLLNIQDDSWSIYHRGIFISNENWQTAFAALAASASIIFMLVERLTPNISFELEYLATKNLLDRTVFVTAKDILGYVRELGWTPRWVFELPQNDKEAKLFNEAYRRLVQEITSIPGAKAL